MHLLSIYNTLFDPFSVTVGGRPDLRLPRGAGALNAVAAGVRVGAGTN